MRGVELRAINDFSRLFINEEEELEGLDSDSEDLIDKSKFHTKG